MALKRDIKTYIERLRLNYEENYIPSSDFYFNDQLDMMLV